jgi:hypothetical protein
MGGGGDGAFIVVHCLSLDVVQYINVLVICSIRRKICVKGPINLLRGCDELDEVCEVTVREII